MMKAMQRELSPIARAFSPPARDVLQRKCACGGTSGPMGECEACRKKRRQGKSENSGLKTQNDFAILPTGREVPRAFDQLPDAEARSLLGHDFRRVRIDVDKGKADKTGPRLRMSPLGSNGDHSKISEIAPDEETEDVTQSPPGTASKKVHSKSAEARKAPGPARRCKMKSGPTYSPSGTIEAMKSGGGKKASFGLSAEFENDPVKGPDPVCCEIRQYILWTKAADVPRTAAFKPTASFKDNTWYEDRDPSGKRYGHRSGPYAECVDINHYEDAAAKRDCTKGLVYSGRDRPKDGSGAKTGEWKFNLKVVDTCDAEKPMGVTAAVTVDWDAAQKELQKPERSLAPPMSTYVAPPLIHER